MRVLFIGLGSIGRRNLEACLRVRPQYQYAALRQQISADVPEALLQFTEQSEVEAFSPDLIWICTPTAMHLDSLKKVIHFKASFFIEKPLAHTAEQVSEMEALLRASKAPFFYGCILRHHPLIQRVKQFLSTSEVGRPLSYTLYCGSYLPDWRPGVDYRQNYSANKAQGGGVTLDLIHEFDYAEYWFGAVQKIQGSKTRLSSLEIDTDDYCSAQLSHSQGVQGSITLNYFRPIPRRDFEIITEKSVIQGNLITGELTLPGGKENHAISRDALHDRQSEAVFSQAEKNQSGTSIHEVSALVQTVLTLPFIPNPPTESRLK